MSLPFAAFPGMCLTSRAEAPGNAGNQMVIGKSRNDAQNLQSQCDGCDIGTVTRFGGAPESPVSAPGEHHPGHGPETPQRPLRDDRGQAQAWACDSCAEPFPGHAETPPGCYLVCLRCLGRIIATEVK